MRLRTSESLAEVASIPSRDSVAYLLERSGTVGFIGPSGERQEILSGVSMLADETSAIHRRQRLAASPDGRYLAVAGPRGGVVLLNVPIPGATLPPRIGRVIGSPPTGQCGRPARAKSRRR